MGTIAQKPSLVKEFVKLFKAHRSVFGQQRVYERALALASSEIVVFGRHTVTQSLMALGLTDEDWSGWYRLFSQRRFKVEAASRVMVGQTLEHVPVEAPYIVAGDATQTPRSSKKIEGSGWQKNPRNPPWKRGIHLAQRWFNLCWLTPDEEGYSRALPLWFVPAFTDKSVHEVTTPCKEWEAARDTLAKLRSTLDERGRETQPILMLGDGNYDTVGLWNALPSQTFLLARAAKNRCLHHLPTPSDSRGRPAKYGQRALAPNEWLSEQKGWSITTLTIRGRQRVLKYRVEGPFLRKQVPDRPLFLIAVRGQTYQKHGRRKHREPRFYLVNAVSTSEGWELPLPVKQLLFWTWQRWEIEVAHRELKSNFGLGHKQCSNPYAAVLSVQWSAWVYSLMLLAGYRCWRLANGPPVPTRWWHGSGRWSLNTLWRAFRAAFWGAFEFRPTCLLTPNNLPENTRLQQALYNAAYGSSRL